MATRPVNGLEGRTDPFCDLDQGGFVMAYYIWIDGFSEHTRGKTKTLPSRPNSLDEIPEWAAVALNRETGGYNSVILKPVAFYRDPFRKGDNILVMCETFFPDGTPFLSNKRHACNEKMVKSAAHKPWFGIEQEYTLFSSSGLRPYDWPEKGFPTPQCPRYIHYCGVGTSRVSSRKIAESHYRACLYAGIKIAGSNAEVMPSQWEYQIGPCEGIEIGDMLWASRWILHRVAEEFDVVISFDPKPVAGDWNGNGLHANISTEAMRQEGGLTVIKEAIEKFAKKHDEHIQVYDLKGGEDNRRRLTGLHFTASIDKFTSGVEDRDASVRIPFLVEQAGCGYFEDRRPASNADPYVIADRIVQTMILDDIEENQN